MRTGGPSRTGPLPLNTPQLALSLSAKKPRATHARHADMQPCAHPFQDSLQSPVFEIAEDLLDAVEARHLDVAMQVVPDTVSYTPTLPA